MPKQVYKIDQFHGGLNDESDPRDFDDNELQFAQDIDVSHLGRIVLMGDDEAHPTITGGPGGQMPAGYGLFFTRMDHPKMHEIAKPYYWETQVSLLEPEGDEYVLSFNTKNADFGTIRTYSYSDDDWGGVTNPYQISTYIGESVYVPDPIFFSSAGVIRTFDTDFNNIILSAGGRGFKTSWIGFIHRNRFTGTWLDTSSSNVGNSAAQFPTPGKCFRGWYTSETHCYNNSAHVKKGPDSDADTPLALSYSNSWSTDNVSVEEEGYVVGSLGNDQAPNQYYNDRFLLTSISEPTEEGGWRGFKQYSMSFIYDEKQESLPAIMGASSNYDDTWEDSIKYFRLRVRPKHAYEEVVADSVEHPTPLNPRITGGRIYFREVNEAKVPYGDLILLFEFDLDKGIKKVESDLWIPWANDEEFFPISKSVVKSPGGSSTYTNMLKFDSEPTSPSYEAMSGVPAGEDSIHAVFKTGTIVNNRLYAGNIAQVTNRAYNYYGHIEPAPAGDDNYNSVKHRDKDDFVFKGDAMLKSPINSYDVLPSKNTIEVTIGDGDEITCLENYADRLLQFKRTKLHIINVSQDYEFLEGTYDTKGVWGPAAVCKTDFGVAWVNEHGCYIYDGKEVKNLLERQSKRIVSSDTWNTFTAPNHTPSIGYQPKKRKLLVLDSVNDQEGQVFIYDILTQSWVVNRSSAGRLNVTGQISNFIVDKDGDLMWRYHTASNRIWNDSPAAAMPYFMTKDLDFGLPGVKKKIHKVYISYKDRANDGSGGAGLKIQYTVNGGTAGDTKYNFNGVTSGSSDYTPLDDANNVNKWTVAELTPATSSEANNIYSIALYFYASGNINADFEINDISIVYRAKNIK